MTELIFYVYDRGSVLDQERSQGVPEIMEPDLAQSGLREHRREVSMIEIVRVEDFTSK